ncbi:uncharacterized protein TNCV_509391, partial [Trichonephila clavipes]
MDLVEKKLKEWKLEEYLSNFEIQTYIGNYDCKPSTKDKLDLAKDIVSTFPVLKGSDGEGYEQWFSPGVRGAPATGFIADRFKNFRARNLSVVEKEELGIGQIKKNIKENIIKYQGTEDSSVEFLQKQQWLKENTSPPDKVGEGIDKFMKDDRLLGGERRQPFILAIGEKCRPQQLFLIFEENCIE